MAEVHRQLGRHSEELQALQKVLAVVPDDVSVMLRLGELEKILKLPASLDRFRKIMQLAPESIQAAEARYYLRHASKAA